MGGGTSLARAELTAPPSHRRILSSNPRRTLWTGVPTSNLSSVRFTLSMLRAINISLTTTATVGMTPTDSIGGFDSATLESTIFFMFSFKTRSLYLIAVKGQFTRSRTRRCEIAISTSTIAMVSTFLYEASLSMNPSEVRRLRLPASQRVLATALSIGPRATIPQTDILILRAIGH